MLASYLLKFEELKETLSANQIEIFEDFLKLSFNNLDNMTNSEDIIIQFKLIDKGFEEFASINNQVIS